MSEIIRARESIQLSLPEGSTVIILPRSPKRARGKAAEKSNPPPLVVDPEVIRAVIQGYREYGEEGNETEHNLGILERQMKEARSRGFNYGDFCEFLEDAIDQTSTQLRGSMGGNIGTMPNFLSNVREMIIGKAEEVWTEPLR